jgi:hypothetical protein
MHPRFAFRFTFGFVVGISLVIWSAYSLVTSSRAGTGSQIVAFYRGVAPITQTQMHWALFFLGAVFVGLAFALRPDQ